MKTCQVAGVAPAALFSPVAITAITSFNTVFISPNVDRALAVTKRPDTHGISTADAVITSFITGVSRAQTVPFWPRIICPASTPNWGMVTAGVLASTVVYKGRGRGAGD